MTIQLPAQLLDIDEAQLGALFSQQLARPKYHENHENIHSAAVGGDWLTLASWLPNATFKQSA